MSHVHPSEDFTEKVMTQLNNTQFDVTKYNRPLFSNKLKWTTGILVFGILTATLYIAFTSESSSNYQLPVNVLNILEYYGSFFTLGDNLLMVISAVSLGFWSLMLLDKIMNKLSLA